MLICNFNEDPTIQCVAVEDGVRCNHGAKIKSRKLCSKHYARLTRTGNTHRQLASEAQNARLEELGMLERGVSTICICTHGFIHHYSSKRARRCKIRECRCNKFAGIDATVLSEVKMKMLRIGMYPLNNGAVCVRCNEHIPVGYWHDTHIFIRISEHLKTHQVRKCDLTAYPRTG